MKQTKRQSIQSILQLSDNKFFELFQNLKTIPKETNVSLKVCGFGFRFGKTEIGHFFVESSRSGIITEPNAFSKYAKSKDYQGVSYLRALEYDKLFNLLSEQKFLDTIPNETKIICEMLYVPLANIKTDEYVQFVKRKYSRKIVGELLTIVPLMVEGDFDINTLYKFSNTKIKFINPEIRLSTDIDVSFFTNVIRKNMDFTNIRIGITNHLLYKFHMANKTELTNEVFDVEGFVFEIDGVKLKIVEPI